MRILFIFHTPWIKGGASKSGLTLVKGLQQLGIEVTAACPEEGTLSQTLRNEGIPTETFEYEWAYPYFERSFKGVIKFIPKLLLNKVRNRKALKEMTAFAERLSPDIIHTNSGVLDIGVRLAERLNIPHVSHFREFGWKDCNAIMCHEERMRAYPLQHGIAIGKEILNYHIRPKDNITLIYNGIVHSSSCRYTPNKEPWLLYVGGLFKEKGIEDLLNAYSRLNPDIRKRHHLKIAGSVVDDRYMEHLEKLTGRLCISEEVEWMGERNDVDELMFKAKALIVPSHQEAFGRIVVESMTNGCIVIGRNTAGIKEQLDNGVTITGEEIGFRYETVEQLAALMQHVISQDPLGFEPMIKRGQQTIGHLYTTDAYVSNVVNLYKKIIDKRQ